MLEAASNLHLLGKEDVNPIAIIKTDETYTTMINRQKTFMLKT